MLDEFKRQYIEKCINGDGFDDELNILFESILLEEMNDDAEKMSLFIQSINDENRPKEPTELELLKQENKQLQEESEMIQTAFMELSDYVFSK
nr:MAG TPA: Myb-related protein [Caudoviricetes sp.]